MFSREAAPDDPCADEERIPLDEIPQNCVELVPACLFPGDGGSHGYLLTPFHGQEVVGALLDALAERRAAKAVRDAREQSRQAAKMVSLLGYSEDWAIELEERAFRDGRLWRESAYAGLPELYVHG